MESGARRQRLTAWKRQAANETLQLSVSEPRQGGGIVPRSGKRWLYTINCSLMRQGEVVETTTVERQSRDFSHLLAMLLEQYPGIVLPSLPREHTRSMLQSGQKKEVLLAKRSITFDYFLKYLAQHPLVSRLKVFRSFLMSPLKFSKVLESGHYGGWKCDLETTLTQHVQSKGTKAGTEQWLDFDWFVEDTLGVHLNFDVAGESELVESLRKVNFNSGCLYQNQKALALLKSALKKTERRQMMMGMWNQELSSIFSSLSMVERTATEKSEGFNRKRASEGSRLSCFGSSSHEEEALHHFCGNESIALGFEQLASKASTQAEGFIQTKRDLKERVLCMLSFEILCCEGLSAQLCFAKEKLLQWQESQRKLFAIQKEMEGIRDQEKREQKLPSLQKAQAVVEKTSMIATHWARAVITLESKQVRESRALRMRNLCLEFEKLQTSFGQLTQTIWSSGPDEHTFTGYSHNEAPFGIAVAEPVQTMQSGISSDSTEDVNQLRLLLAAKERELDELKRAAIGIFRSEPVPAPFPAAA